MSLVLFIVGLVLLILGADLLVRGASRVAEGFGISPLIIGLTIVAFGTSAPELAVSIEAALSNQASIAMGNVVGSNIFNVLFILGVSALIVPLVVSKQLIRLDVPLMIVLSGIVLWVTYDGNLSRLEGVVFVCGLIGYVAFLIIQQKKNPEPVSDTPKDLDSSRFSGTFWNLVFVAVGLGLLVLGSNWFVQSAIEFAQFLGVSDVVIGLTIVAAGTSMPEVVTSITAALKGERDIAVGNVVGSNVFNIMGVLGISAAIAPSGIDVSTSMIAFDIPVMIAVALACLPIFVTGGVIDRFEGFIFLGYYVVYTSYLILAATSHDALGMFNATMMYFVLPLTLLTLIVMFVQHRRKINA